MRIFVVLICSFALASLALGAQDEKKKEKPKKKGAQAGQVSQPAGKATGKPATAGKPGTTGRPAGAGEPAKAGKPAYAGKTAATGKAATGKPFKPQHFNVPKQPNTAKAPPVKFQQGRRIKGSQNWQGANYTVFRTYTPVWHDRGWWNSHYNRVVFVFGGWYYWNAGWWYPAWGYAPNA